VPVLTVLDNAGGVYEAILPLLTTIEAALDARSRLDRGRVGDLL
jgi:hypothetical protein